jgi:pimeloyl-ACP methyl ester carboxylesterase
VLIDSAADVDDDETLDGYQGMMHVFGHGSDEERAAVFQMVSGLILGDEELAATWIPSWDALDREQLVTAGRALLGRDDISGRVGEIRCPILAVHGTADEAIGIDRARALADATNDHRGVVEIAGAAHAPNMTHPAEVNAALREFLATLD